MKKSIWLLTSIAVLFCLPAFAVQEIDLDLPSPPTYTPLPTEAPTEIPTGVPTETPAPVFTPMQANTITDTPEIMEIEKEAPTEVPTPKPKKPAKKRVVLEDPDLPAIPADQLYFLGKFGFLAPDVLSAHGWLESGTEKDKKVFGLNDEIILKLDPARKVKPGHLFVFYREAGLLKDPGSGQTMGDMVRPLAIGEVVRVINTQTVVGKITYSFMTLYPNDKFVFLNSWRVTLGSAAEQKEETKGVLVVEQNNKSAILMGDSVYLNIGSVEGVKAGDIFHVVKEDATEGSPSDPFVPIGGLKVLGVLPHSCVAQLNWSKELVKPGSPVEKATVDLDKQAEKAPTPASQVPEAGVTPTAGVSQ